MLDGTVRYEFGGIAPFAGTEIGIEGASDLCERFADDGEDDPVGKAKILVYHLEDVER